MGFELIVALLSITLIGIPVLAWATLKRISAADRMRKNNEELHSLENSLSLMIKELQDSVKKALEDMEESADRLNQTIDKADDRIRELQYYYEYGDELRPIVQPRQPEIAQAPTPQATAVHAPQGQAIKHKEVHELSRRGWSAAQIAKHTGMSADEVQLIINLMEISTMDILSQPRQPRQPMV